MWRSQVFLAWFGSKRFHVGSNPTIYTYAPMLEQVYRAGLNPVPPGVSVRIRLGVLLKLATWRNWYTHRSEKPGPAWHAGSTPVVVTITNKMEKNEIKKALYKANPKVMAKIKWPIVKGIAFYTAEVEGVFISFNIDIKDLGDAPLEETMEAKLLMRYLND